MNGRRQKRLDRRRADFYRLRAQGKSLPEVIDTISKAYNASKQRSTKTGNAAIRGAITLFPSHRIRFWCKTFSIGSMN